MSEDKNQTKEITVINQHVDNAVYKKLKSHAGDVNKYVRDIVNEALAEYVVNHKL